jgi:hypothetical protein
MDDVALYELLLNANNVCVLNDTVCLLLASNVVGGTELFVLAVLG